ncbi:MAG: hypothetical protein ACPGXX_15840 [Planctomycetaceae bacterium]
MTGITEETFPTVLLLLGVAVILLVLRVRHSWKSALVAIVLAAAIAGIDAVVIGPTEHLEARLQELRQGFVDADFDRISQYLAADRNELRETAAAALDLVEISPAMRIRDFSATIEPGDQVAIVEFRANGPVSGRAQAGSAMMGFGGRHVVTRWKTRWILEQDQWVLDQVTRLNPLNGQEIDTLAVE